MERGWKGEGCRKSGKSKNTEKVNKQDNQWCYWTQPFSYEMSFMGAAILQPQCRQRNCDWVGWQPPGSTHWEHLCQHFGFANAAAAVLDSAAPQQFFAAMCHCCLFFAVSSQVWWSMPTTHRCLLVTSMYRSCGRLAFFLTQERSPYKRAFGILSPAILMTWTIQVRCFYISTAYMLGMNISIYPIC